MSLVADEISAAARKGDPQRVRELLRPLDVKERRALLAELKELAKGLRRDGRLWTHPRTYECIGLALTGCTAGAATTATHITSWWRWGVTGELPVVEVLVDRDVAWLPDLLDRLADGGKQTDMWGGNWRIVDELRLVVGAPRPATRFYLEGLATSLTAPHRKAGDDQRTLLDRIRTDDELVALVPEILRTADPAVLGSTEIHVYDPETRKRETRQRTGDDTWPGVVRTLCDDGRLDRGATIDTCLTVLLRGADAGPTAGHVAILDGLHVTGAEIAARRSYVQLAGDGTGPCAKHAQRALRAAWDSGELDRETVLEVSRLVLARPEKGLVTTQLGWLDKLARQSAPDPDDVLLVVADAFGHERTDVQERALSVVAKHVASAAPPTVAELVVAAGALAPSLRPKAAGVLGTAPLEEPAAYDAPAGLVPATSAWPRPPRDVGELAETCAALVEALGDPVLLESVLAGMAALRNTDRAGFDAAMAPLRDRLSPRAANPDSFSAVDIELFVSSPQAKLLRTVLLDPPPPERKRRLRDMFARSRHVHANALPNPPLSPTGLSVQRMRELAGRVLAGESADLVAVPTEASGHIDPAALVDRLRRGEAVGREPWPADLQQALLRLPRTVDPAVVTDAAALRSPAGRQLAVLLRDGHRDPVSRPVVEPIAPRSSWMWPAHPQGDVALVALDGPQLDPVDIATLAMSLPDPHHRAGRVTRDVVAAGMGHWPTALPSHPEVVAAHALLALCDLPIAAGLPAGRDLLAALPALHGPHGQAAALAVAYALAATDAADRTAGVDAVVGMAARGVDGAATGQALRLLARGDDLKLGRVASSLGDALRAGRPAAGFVWQLTQSALPVLLGSGTRDTHRVLAVAADAAALVRARGAVDGLAQVAQRGGTSRLVTEARRLQGILSP